MKLLAAACLLLSLAALLPLSGQSPRNPAKEEPKAKDVNASNGQKQSPPKPPPPVVVNQPSATIRQNATSEHRSAPDDNGSPDWVMWSAIVQAACAAIVAVFTGVLLFYSHRGWQVARKAADAAARSTEIAERVYRESAQATEENLRLTRESNEATLNSILIAKSQRDTLANALRAWVVLRTVQPWNHKTNKPPRVRVELQNTGFSPAIGVHPHGTMSLTESVDFLDHEDKPPGEHDHAPLSVGFVGAGNFTKLEITGLELTADQKQAVQSGELLIYAHGLVDYVDAFGTQRRTLWAALYEPGKDYWTTASKHNSQT